MRYDGTMLITERFEECREFYTLLLEVDSLEEEVSRLSAFGMACSEPHEIPGGAVVTVTDPDDRMIQLIAYSPQG